MRPTRFALLAAALALLTATSLPAQRPEWIWTPTGTRDDQTVAFRAEFTVDRPIVRARMTVSCDNRFTAWVAGKKVAEGNEWWSPVHTDLTPTLRGKKEAVVALEGWNQAGPAALCARLHCILENGDTFTLRSSATDWRCAEGPVTGFEKPAFDASAWRPAQSLGPVAQSTAPWGDVLDARHATPVEDLEVLVDGFEVERVCSAQAGQGSWVAMTFDPKGRLVVSPQYGPLLRITLPDMVEALPTATQLVGAQGLAFVGDVLYVNVSENAEKGGGLWRLRDADGDDNYEDVERLAGYGPGGEHGSHAIVPGPDGRLYLVHGNMTNLPESISPRSPFRHGAEDVLLPREWDPRGHAVGVLAPAGRVLRTDPDGNGFEIVAAGMRNAYDLAFDAEGHLFTFDSDMEWDRGLPWYRPTRVLHVVAGAEYGWRSGSAKWPAHYFDSLGAVVDVGESSPTGMEFGTRSHFPEPWRSALFLGDWSKGRIIAAHIHPDGAGFRGEAVDFLRGKPLNVTDLTFGPDGALWFVTGGRRTQAGLYRLAATTPQPIASVRTPAVVPVPELEIDTRPLDQVWPDLGSPDRTRRFRARVAIEARPLAEWRGRAMEETDPARAISALLALIRVGDVVDRNQAMEAVVDEERRRFASQKLGPPIRRDWMRTVAVGLSRGFVPTDDTRRALMARVEPFFVSEGEPATAQLAAELLVALDKHDVHPSLTPALMARLRSAKSPTEQIHWALLVRNRSTGWTPELRTELFEWIRDAKSWEGGESLRGYVRSIERRVLTHVAESDRARLEAIAKQAEDVKHDKAARRAMKYTDWKLADLEPHLKGASAGRSFEQGQKMFSSCATCHTFAGQGAAIGPDLTSVSRRYSRRDLIAKILDPNRAVSDQYRNTVYTLVSGDVIVGRPVGVTDAAIEVCIDPIADRRITVRRDAIRDQQASQWSTMPPGLLGALSREEILDLLAYLESEGDAEAEAFQR